MLFHGINHWNLLNFLIAFDSRDVYTSVPKGVQQSFPNLSFIVWRNRVKNLQNNHFHKATVFSSVYTKVLFASALSETFTYQSYQNIYQKLQLSQIHSILPNWGKRRNASHQSSKFPLKCLEQLAWGLSRVQLAPSGCQGEGEGGESKAPARSNSARLAGAGLEGQSTSASQALPITGSKGTFHSFLSLASASLREGGKTKALSIQHYFWCKEDPKAS